MEDGTNKNKPKKKAKSSISFSADIKKICKNLRSGLNNIKKNGDKINISNDNNNDEHLIHY